VCEHGADLAARPLAALLKHLPAPDPILSTPPSPPEPAAADRATLPITLLMQAAASAAALAPTVAAPPLLAELRLPAVAVGVYIAIVYFGAMLSSQIGATLVRRWGPIRCSQAALALCAVGVLLVGVPNLGLAILGALLIGFGYGPITPASSEMLARTTPPHRYAFVFSVKQTGVPLGGVLAGALVPVILQATSIAVSLAAVALFCAVGAASGEMLRARLDAQRNPASPLPRLQALLQPLRFVLGHPVLRPLALCTLVFSTVQVSLGSYLVSFLDGPLQWTLVQAGLALSVAQTGGVVGRVAWGLIADRWSAPRQTLLGLAVAMALLGLAMPLLSPAHPPAAVMALLALYGATAIGWNGVFLATVARVVPQPQAAMATGGCLFFTYFGVVIGPPLFGAVGDALGSLATAFALLALPLGWTLWVLGRSRWG
jgi:MFS family permease